MTKRVLDIGNCDHDHGQIERMLRQHFAAQVIRADHATDALQLLRSQSFDLVTVNRQLDADGSEGLDLIKAIKQDKNLQSTPVMMITNYPEFQDSAVAAGALPGFGKRSLNSPETIEKLKTILKD